MKILYKYTTRSRRGNFLRGIDSIVNNTIDKGNYHILISVEQEMYDTYMHPLPQLDCPHTYKINSKEPTTKVDAINRDLNEFLEYFEADIIVNMSDDVVFIESGFDNIIRKEFISSTIAVDNNNNLYANANLDQCLHFPDGNRKDLLTVSILGREYYNRDKYIYHPDYKSLYCDNEAMEVAKIRGCYKFVDRVIFNHLHPAYGKAVFDRQYAITESYSNLDCQTYIKRKENNFYEAINTDTNYSC